MAESNDAKASGATRNPDGSGGSNGSSPTSGWVIAIIISIVVVGVILWITNRGSSDEANQPPPPPPVEAATATAETGQVEQPASDIAASGTFTTETEQGETPSDTTDAEVATSNGESPEVENATTEDPASVPEQEIAANSAEGIATYKSDDLHGQMTASGVPYDKDAMVAAHKDLPFGTVVTVVNLYNGKSVVVEIVDRMPSTVSALIDISSAADARD